jgi:ABC-type Fe3+ transport system substrate-binding protein
MRRLAALLAPVLLLGGCFAQGDASSTAQPSAAATITLAGGVSALRWGDGPYGVVLLHDANHEPASWAALAHALAADGMTAVAPQTTDVAALTAAMGALRSTASDQSSATIERVAVIAAGTGIDAVAALAASNAALIDQVILVSPTSDARWTAEFPKLFVAGSASGEAAAARSAEASAAGAWNALLLVDGSGAGQALLEGTAGAELVSAVVRRLDERR